MLARLGNIAHERGYWFALLSLGAAFIAVALYYQYVLEELPCVLCIQVRVWVFCLILIAIVALLFDQSWARRTTHIATILVAAGLLERSYLLLGTEKGFVFRDCGFDLGLPPWLALDIWFPRLFRVEASCGYTPELVLGITMAEALMFFSVTLLLVGLALTIASFLRREH